MSFLFFFTGITYLLMFVFGHMASAKADEVFMVGGANVASIPGAPNGAYMPAIFNGELCKGDNHCTVVPFDGGAGVLTSPNDPQPLDQSVADATGGLVQAIKNTPGPKVAVAISAGVPVVEEAARQLQNDPNGPDASELKLILAGGIDQGLGKLVPDGSHLNSIGYTVHDSPPTKYPSTVVTNEFDGLATVPADPMAHPLAAANVAAGGLYAHVGYFTTSLNDPNNVVTHDGNVTNVVMQNTGELPLVEALNEFGQPQLAQDVKASLQTDVNAAGATPDGAQPQLQLPPQVLDQLLNFASPMFAQGINGQTQKLVDALVPIFANDPQMRQYIPPALLDETIPAPPPANAVAVADVQGSPQDNPPAPPPDDQSGPVQTASADITPVNVDLAPVADPGVPVPGVNIT